MSETGTKIVKQPLENITLNGKPVYIFVEEEAQRERDALHAAEVRKQSSGVGYVAPASKYGNTSGTRSQYRNLTSSVSPETLAHLNYLNEKGGTKAVNDFLTLPKQVDQLGPIEAALKDAEEKMKFYQTQTERAMAERDKFASVAEQLRNALNIIQGKPVGGVVKQPRAPRQVRMQNGEGYEKLPRGFWVDVVNELLANGRTIPRQQLLDEMRAKTPSTPSELASAALTRAIAIGQCLVTPDRQVKLNA